MKTIEECLDEAVKRKSEFSSEFKELMLKYKTGDCVRVFVESVIEEAMNIHAKQCCDLQKNVCAEKVEKLEFENGRSFDKESILSTPNVAEKP